MKTFVLIAGLFCGAATVFAGDIGVSITVDQPGLYGRIDIGNVPAPQVIYPQPVVAVPPAYVVQAPPPPIYLHVPPGYIKHWGRHCEEFHACGRPVFFVQDGWYNNVFVPEREREHEHHGEDRGGHHDHGRGGGHGKHGEHGGHDHGDQGQGGDR